MVFSSTFTTLQKENNYMNLIEINRDRIIALCKKYKVNKLFVFDSILTYRFNKESDVDFLILHLS